MPLFGNLYGLEVVVDETLIEDEGITFNAGRHREVMRMAYRDFEGLVEPRVALFSFKVP